MESLVKYGVIPIDYASLRASYPSLKALEDKVCDLEKKSTIIRLKRGLYIVSPAVSKREVSIELIANHLYGPSYVSKESALRFYGLIPERVYNTVSMTIKRRQRFRNKYGQYDYISCPVSYYSIGIRQVIREDYAFMIASPEKALCDQIVYTPRLQLRSVKALLAYLEEDIRFDMDEFYKMDVSIFEQCVGKSKKKDTIDHVIKLLKQ